MNKIFEKLKAINWKSKKSIIAYAIILAIIVGGTGTGLALKHFNNSSDIVKTDVDIKDKNTSKSTEDKKEDKKSDDKKDTDKKDENSKPTENKEEDKKDTNETSKTDNKEEDKKTNTQVNNTNNSNNSNSNNNNTTNNKPSTHTHSWQPQYQTINHPEQGHNEKVLVKPAWTEEIPIYEYHIYTVCSTCGWVVASPDKPFNEQEYIAHSSKHLEANEPSGNHTEEREIQVGVNKVQHPAEYQNKWVVDKPAWTEQKLVGYKCSCGATK